MTKKSVVILFLIRIIYVPSKQPAKFFIYLRFA